LRIYHAIADTPPVIPCHFSMKSHRAGLFEDCLRLRHIAAADAMPSRLRHAISFIIISFEPSYTINISIRCSERFLHIASLLTPHRFQADKRHLRPGHTSRHDIIVS
jgi:hypothetical protein